MESTLVDVELERISQVLEQLIDKGIFPWLDTQLQPTEAQIIIAATAIADRL